MSARWGIVATVLAPAETILRFAAYHLDLGAHRVFVYLDAPNPMAEAALKAHPKCRVTVCDDTYWAKRKGGKPAKHQVRQTFNATRTYARQKDLEWLAHIDVDEFIVPRTGSVSDMLDALPATIQTLRVRPMELLAGGDGTAFKAFVPAGPDRRARVARMYPTFGDHLKGGFLSHVAGKIFVRRGLSNPSLRIHNVFAGDAMNPGEAETQDVDLAHLHAIDWDTWRAHFTYRHAKGSYRPDIPPAHKPETGTLPIHQLFDALMADAGEDGLRAFYDEVIADSPILREKLLKDSLLKRADLDLDSKFHQYFPKFVGQIPQLLTDKR